MHPIRQCWSCFRQTTKLTFSYYITLKTMNEPLCAVLNPPMRVLVVHNSLSLPHFLPPYLVQPRAVHVAARCRWWSRCRKRFIDFNHLLKQSLMTASKHSITPVGHDGKMQHCVFLQSTEQFLNNFCASGWSWGQSEVCKSCWRCSGENNSSDSWLCECKSWC